MIYLTRHFTRKAGPDFKKKNTAKGILAHQRD